MKKHLLLFVLVALFASCVTDGLETTLPATEPAADPMAVSIDEALGEMYSVMDELYGPATRSSRPAIATIETFKGKHAAGQTRSDEPLPENLYYIVNFENEGGFAIMGADRRVDPLICITEAGSMTLADLLSPSVTTRSGSEPYTLENLWTPYSSVEDWYDPEDDYDPEEGEYQIGTLGDALQDRIKKIITRLPPEPTPTPVSYTYVYGEWTDAVKTGPFLTTKWHQGNPFNLLCPGQYVAGCVPIAVAQIIAYNEKPSASYFGVTSTWKEIKNYDPAKNVPDIRRDISIIISAIGSGVNARYNYWGSGETFALPINAKKYMKKELGYGGAKRRVGYKESVITSMVDKGKPVFIAAIDKKWNSAHAWVIDGSMRQNRTVKKYRSGQIEGTSTESRLLLHCNFGWSGRNDGYYLSNVFDLSKGPVATDTGDTEGGNTGNYDWWYRIIEY